MLRVPQEEVRWAFGLLEPSDRALLELSLHRGVADHALAELLRTDVDSVARLRTESLERLADALNVPPADVEDALIRQWRREPREAPARRAEAPLPKAKPGPGGRRGLWAVAAAGAIAAIAFAVVLAGGGEDDEVAGGRQTPVERDTAGPAPDAGATPDGAASPDAGSPAPPARPAGPVAFRALPGPGGARGRALLLRRGPRRLLRLRLSGLSKAGYAIWLYNSVDEARFLGRFDGPVGYGRVRLPQRFRRFRYVDVARESAGGNVNHGGASVLRLAVADLRRARP
jgi:hypothetical protein